MSQIDSRLAPALRDALLSEVQAFLPAFLSAAAVEREGSVLAASELLRLAEADLRRVLAVHLMLSAPVRELVGALQTGVRRPLTSSVRPRVAGRTVTSAIDWASTVRHRSTSSPLGDIWVTRPARRVFDIPENRALAWLLRVLEDQGHVAVSATGDAPGSWGIEIRTMVGAIRRARRTAWLEGVPPEWPGDDVFGRLRADRMGFYRLRVTDAARYVRRTYFAPTETEIVEALSERYFEPQQDWKLFEIAVLMRLTRALGEVGTRQGATRMLGDSKSRPFATFRVSPRRAVRVWYQTWPPTTRPSELEDAVRHYELSAGGSRPDIVVELLDDGMTSRALLLELKASSSATYLSSGLAQLLGYLRDRPGLFTAEASAWLVAPAGPSFVSKPAGGRSLWVTTADDVATALVAEVMAAK